MCTIRGLTFGLSTVVAMAGGRRGVIWGETNITRGKPGGQRSSIVLHGRRDDLSQRVLYKQSAVKGSMQFLRRLVAVGIVLAVALMLGGHATAQPCVPAPSGLAGWWPGDCSAMDSSGVNHGTLRNGATFAAGMVLGAFSLDGVDDEIEIPYAASINPIAALTLDAWINVYSLSNDANGGYQAIVAMSEQAGGGRAYWLGITGTGPNHVGTAGNVHLEGFGGAVAWRTSAAVIIPGRWHHIAGVIEPSMNRFEIYVDAVLQPIVSGQGGAQLGSVTNVPLRVGYSDPGSSYHFNGRIDEVEVHNRALAPSEIQAIYAAASAGKCKPDMDGDGAPDECDCLPADPTNRFVSREISGVLVLNDFTASWNDEAAYAGSATFYDVARGDLLLLTAAAYPGGAACMTATGSLYVPQYSELPTACSAAAGDGCWYLVRGQNDCGAGTWGAGAPVPHTLDTASPCP